MDPKKALAREQLGLAREALSTLEELHKQAKVRAYDSSFGVWERRQVEAVRDAGANRAEFRAALEGYVKRLKARQPLVEEAYRTSGATPMDVLDEIPRLGGRGVAEPGEGPLRDE
jgi:hypothetical protein